MKNTRAIRKLIPEHEILEINYRVTLGVPLNTAARLIRPDMSTVSTVRLVRLHAEMEEALKQEDFVLYNTIFESLFPPWTQDRSPQPYTSSYLGQFPYGNWEHVDA